MQSPVTPSLLWVDLTVSGDRTGPPRAFSEVCQIRHVDQGALGGLDMDRRKPDSICLDYDYPDIEGLTFLKQTRAAFPSTPVIMLTVQHSENLAIWAFRARVWDYLVKPVSSRDATRCIDGLRKLLEIGKRQRNRAISMPSPPLPREARFHGAVKASKVGPALAYIRSNFCRRVLEQDVASICNLSSYQFSRVFKEELGITFQDYLVRVRLYEARRLLANPAASVTDVAYTVGFNSPSYFSRAFRQLFQDSPSSYRKRLEDDPDIANMDDGPAAVGEAERPALHAFTDIPG